MKRIVQRLSSGRGDVIAHFKMGSTTLNILSRNKCLKTLVNGAEVLTIENKKEERKRVAHVLTDLVETIVKKASPSKITGYKREKDVTADEIMPAVMAPFKNMELVIKPLRDQKSVGDSLHQQFSPDKGMNMDILARNIMVFASKVDSVSRMIQAARNDALVLARKQLVSSMWGANIVQRLLDGINRELCEWAPVWDKIDLSNEMIAKSSQRLCHKLRTNLLQECAEEQKVVTDILIPNVLSSYDNIKEAAIKGIVAFAPLVYVDEVFKEHTSYPANWFLADDVQEGLRQEYDFLLHFLSEVPNIEAKVIDPLDFLSVKFLNHI